MRRLCIFVSQMFPRLDKVYEFGKQKRQNMNYSVTAIIKDHTDKKGRNGIYLRISINRKNKYYPTGLKIEKSKWNNEKVLGRTDDAFNMNAIIAKTKTKVNSAILELQKKDIAITHDNLFNLLEGPNKNTNTKDDFFEFCQEALKNFDIGNKTRSHYNTFLNKLKEFQVTIYFSDIDLDFVERFNLFLKEKGYMQNTIHGYHKRMKKFINRAISLDVLIKNPYKNFHVRTEETVKIYLSEKEVEKLEDLENVKQLPPHLLILTKTFLFSCYTGLRYSDIKQLRWKDIEEDKLYLKTEKSSKVISIPLTNKAKKHLPERENAEEKVFDIVSNQKANISLKLIAMYAGIDKRITYHTSRHTFATISLSLGIPLKVIQSILGHSSIETTEIYAKIVDGWKDKEMAKWDN